MVVAAPASSIRDRDHLEKAEIPSPLFSRFDGAIGCPLVVEIVGCEEDLLSIGSLPTFDGAVDWRFRRTDQSGELDALFTLVIWSDGFAQELPLFLVDRNPASTVLIAYRPPQAPPRVLNGRPTSRLPFDGSVQGVLRKLISTLVVPVVFEGLICVDHADIALAVNRGGDMRQFAYRGPDLQRAAAAMRRDIRAHLSALGPEASVCVSLSAVAAALTWSSIDEILQEMLRPLHPDVFLAASAVILLEDDARISVLTISGGPNSSSALGDQ